MKSTEQKIAIYLGYLGLIPFILSLIMAVYFEQFKETSEQAFIVYSIVIISFMSGIHWGIAINSDDKRRTKFIVSTIPPVLVWFAFLCFPSYFLVITLGFVHLAGLRVDRMIFEHLDMQSSYLRMRIRLAAIVAGLHFLLALSIT